MDKDNSQPKSAAFQLAVYWLIVGLPLIWGVWKTVIKLPALFQ